MDDGGSNVGEGREQATTDVAFGDFISVKIRGGSWWPAQVVDENTVPVSARPTRRSTGKACVRLYGSYKHLYVDPIKCRSEFEKVLEKHNGAYQEIYMQALEKDLSSLKPSRSKSKASGSKTKGKGKAKLSGKGKAKRLKQSNVAQNTEDSSNEVEELGGDNLGIQSPATETAPGGTSQESGGRRMRVMSRLGLTAPPGSPFLKD